MLGCCARPRYQAETVDPQDAAKEIELWVPALTEEYVGLTNQYRAIKPIDKSEVSQQDIDDGLVEVLLAKVVYTRKPPFGQRRARIVACGNFGAAGNRDYENPITGERLPDSLAKFALYAGGLDSSGLRVQLRLAARRRWSTLSIDIKKAFLLAPLLQHKSGKRIAVRPPKVLQRTGIIPETEL